MGFHIFRRLSVPQGVLSATEDSRQQTVVDLLTPEEQRFEPFPAGRVKLTGPHMFWAHAFSEKAGDERAARHWSEAKSLLIEGGYKTKPAAVEIITESPDETVIHLTITEGKYHQVFSASQRFELLFSQLAEFPRFKIRVKRNSPHRKPLQIRQKARMKR
jgi:16S rRNA pseudouridine516 synthase